MTAPKLPEGLEPVAWLTTWPKDRCRGAGSFLQRHDPQPRYDCNHYEPLYTADQMRAMFDAATERAAKKCDALADTLSMQWRQGHKKDAHLEGQSDGAFDCAAAIRATGGEG